jgi:predicted anti-sigma-YlaC factor YlaD
MKCEDLMRFLNDYVDGDIDESICKDFEEHMGECNACRVVVDNIRKSIKIYKDEEVFELPVEFRDKLHATLRDKWRASGPGGAPAPDPEE